jgi:hypothetical protein
VWSNTAVPAPDPSWFYSSLAQVTAAIVGFLGAFVILRLLDFINEWRETGDSIVTTRAAFYAKHKELAAAKKTGRETATIESDIARLWGELVRLLTRRNAAAFPSVVNRMTIALLALTAAGILWPLISLSGPSNLTQLFFLVPWVAIVLVAAPVISKEARKQLDRLQATKLSQQFEGQYENYILQFEGHNGADET